MTYDLQAPVSTPARPKRRVPAWIIAALPVVLAAAASAFYFGPLLDDKRPSASPSPSAASFVLRGSLTLEKARGVLNLDDVHCGGMGGYDDIAAGAQVKVTDAAGKTVGVGVLGGGIMSGSGPTRTCEFGFQVPGVRPGAGFYGVEVAHRGVVSYPEAQIAAGWVALSLG